MTTKVRIKYEKKGQLRFLSHLEVKRVLERAVKRAGMALEYSHGFNPRPKMIYGTASSVGLASEAEFVDLVLTQPQSPVEVIKRLNRALPPDIKATVAMELPPGAKPVMAIAAASRYRLSCRGSSPDAIGEALAKLAGQAGYVISRQKLDRVKHIDVGPMILDYEPPHQAGSDVELDICIKDTTEGSAKPREVIEALNAFFGLDVDLVMAVRTAVLTKKNEKLISVL